ncbi:oxidoreductase FAD-binding protein [Penicillium angulare]|uniref:oxidoreductase FAD-binding protein n=1 Tax=Penicillium angulare TaxID=116970 RepID=UPI002541F7D1|nr:oxidoreductase FAD-binding protein [Penicillium angulare]KAJ5288198.1 oxidoreductase FAD-binding protein [Penicillium angulare]
MAHILESSTDSMLKESVSIKHLLSSSATTISPIWQCQALLEKLGSDLVLLPDSTQYQASNKAYFANQQSELHPYCIVTPRTAQEVSTILTTVLPFFRTSDTAQPFKYCPIAIRSGGHFYFAGTSNVDNGITIDLRALNNIELRSDQNVVSIGPGAKWGDVYSILDPLHLIVAGGRAAQVGVGGLTLGGGISYFSPRYGWTCDSIVRAEIVIADGSVITVDEDHREDILIALRGGGSNFGIVTSFDMRVYSQGLVFGGMVYHPIETIDEQLKAVSEISSETFEDGFARGYDVNASLITSFGYAGKRGSAVVNSMVYTDTSSTKEGEEFSIPEVYKSILELPQRSSTLRVAPLREITIEQGSFSPDGRRQLSVVTTHDTTVAMLQATYNRWHNSLGSIRDIPGIVWSISLQPLPAAIYQGRKNAMGLAETNKSLIITLLSASWDNTQDDEKVEEAARALSVGIDDDARQLDAYHPYVYPNYAAEWQDPIASYGAEAVEKLRRVSREVDPEGVFRKIVPRGFKIPSKFLDTDGEAGELLRC